MPFSIKKIYLATPYTHPDNLEVLSYSDNQKHAHRTGLIDQYGEKNPGSKISNKDVVKIREIYSKGKVTQKFLADQHDVAFQTISDIVRGKYRTKQDGPIGDYTNQRQRNTKRDLTTGRFV